MRFIASTALVSAVALYLQACSFGNTKRVPPDLAAQKSNFRKKDAIRVQDANAKPEPRVHVETLDKNGEGPAFTVGQRLGAEDYCGVKTEVVTVQLRVPQMEAARMSANQLFLSLGATPLAPECAVYRNNGKLGQYDADHGITQWISRRRLTQAIDSASRIGTVEYIGVNGWIGKLDDSVPERWKEMRTHERFPEAEISKLNRQLKLYRETKGQIPFHVQLIHRMPPPPEDDPGGIIQQELRRFDVELSSAATPFEKLQALYAKARAVQLADFRWKAGRAYKGAGDVKGIGVSVAKTTSKPEKIVFNYGLTFTGQMATEAVARSWRGQIKVMADQFKPAIEDLDGVSFSHEVGALRERGKIRRLSERIFIVQLSGEPPFGGSAMMILYKDMEHLHSDL